MQQETHVETTGPDVELGRSTGRVIWIDQNFDRLRSQLIKSTKDVWYGIQALTDDYFVNEFTPSPTHTSALTTLY